MLIASDAALRKFLPNALSTVEGEDTLYDKLSLYLRKAERWLADNFVGDELLALIDELPADDELRLMVCQIIALDAFRRAVPSLDLVLTPNGFGIVSNQNIAPASPDRVKRLVDSLLSNRDDLASDLVLLLARREDWPTTEQGQYFGATLWPSLELAPLAGYTADKWQHFKSLRLQVLTIEQELAENFVSEELMARLRAHLFAQSVTAEERTVIDAVRQTELEMLSGKPLDYKRMFSVVDRIKKRPETFPEWQDSYTSQLFGRPSFENRKDAAGYWF